jgi:hypothetical protein
MIHALSAHFQLSDRALQSIVASVVIEGDGDCHVATEEAASGAGLVGI